uniref:Retrovirus-related Pol polyprotein from transposon TNT 1-94 n=1 Tax=Tanacetum cinerariifolium TaxID=118510 RepID=A0A6L2NXG3_TANCI|nr:retrovirus-related Pol polyprotein from transposon TNT 1-94 [Tanacetum cinerariifolium]
MGKYHRRCMYNNLLGLKAVNIPIMFLLDDVHKSSGSRVSWLTMMFFMTRDHILKGDIELHFVPTDLQLADICTKPLAKPSFTRLVAELDMINIEKQVLDQHVEEENDAEFVAIEEVDADQSLEIPIIEKLLDEADKLSKGKQPSAQVVLNEKAMAVHNLEGKKEGSHLLKPEEQQKSIHDFTNQLFRTASLKFSPTLPREPTPSKDLANGKEISIVKEQLNELVTHQEEGELNNQIKELKRISDIKAQKDKSEADPLPITKISYIANSNKEATMKIIRGDNPLNLIVHPNFKLTSLGFSKWLEVHALASKKIRKSNDMLLQSLREKFQWVMDQAKKLGLPLPPSLAIFVMTPKEKKRKRT